VAVQKKDPISRALRLEGIGPVAGAIFRGVLRATKFFSGALTLRPHLLGNS
jgi:hypothetical protein